MRGMVVRQVGDVPARLAADFVFIDIATGGMGVDDPSMTPRYIGIALAVVPTWLLWRALSRSTWPLADGSGLRVRSWFRTLTVPWSRVLNVEWTELQGGRGPCFSHTAVTFETDRLRRVVVP